VGVRRITVATVLMALSALAVTSPATADGSGWEIVNSPNAITTHHNFLNDVACLTDSDCWAAGYHQSPSGYQAILQRWDGISWSLSPVPDVRTIQDDFIQSVACASPTECFAVGYKWSRPDNAYQALIHRWDGASWSEISSGDAPPATNTFLIDVTCSSEGDCFAVGHRQVGLLGGGFGPNQTLVLRWDGSSWMTVASPNTLPIQANSLTSVSCATASDCVAVGYRGSTQPVQSDLTTMPSANQTLALHWDGSSWEILSTPNTSPAQANLLNGVSCAAVDDCWAVGITTSGVNQTLILHWDGAAWSLVGSPNSGPNNANVLFNVDCLAPDDCWAAGYHKPQPWIENLMLHWDGLEWSIATVPNSAHGQTNGLRGISCVPQQGCWAAGNYYGPGSIARTLLLRHQSPEAPLTETDIEMTLEQGRGDVVATAALTSADRQPLAGKEIVFLLNGVEWTRVATDATGVATVSFHRSEIKKGDVVEANFAGGEGLQGSAASAIFME